MYHEDVSCLDCHNPHSNKLKLEGNALCLQCHESTYDRKEHHFHEINTESAQCVNCHMTGKTYMGNDFRRDHSFRIPRPDQSVAHGTSNACNGCHEGKSASWAAENVEKWYGEEREHHFSDDILKGLEGDGYSLVKLINNTAEPAIARATAIEYLERFPLEVFESELSNWARDSSGLVRLELAKFTYNLPLEYKAGIAGMLLKDELRAVRLAAFRSLLLSYNELSETSKKNWRSAEPEYLEFLLHNADFKEGQQNLAQYYSAKQNPEMAIASFEKAIKIDSLFNEPYRNLAVTQSQVGQNEKALNTLNALIQKFPEDERAYYLRSLLHAEENQLSEASEDISVALELNPNPRYFYNAILIEQKLGNVSNASQLLAKALSKYPNDRGLQQLQIN
jgi:predicted CXXCH cytochrome family protein